MVSDPNSDTDTDVNSKVLVIDNATNKLIHTIGVGKSPSFVEYNPSNGNMYVSNSGSGDISVIDSNTNKVIHTIQVGSSSDPSPDALKYNPSNGNMYGTSISDSDGSGNVFVIDSDTDKVIQIVDVGDNPVDIKYNPSNGGIYVVNENSDSVSLITTTKTNSTS